MYLQTIEKRFTEEQIQEHERLMRDYEKTKVLFCSPYSYGENVISGGISIWGKIIVDYSQIANDESLEIIPISFDRKRKVMEVNDFGFKRFYSGFREISKNVKK